MKILEVCLFSAGADGVWQRIKTEAELLSEKHEIRIFSSNFTKGSDELAPSRDSIGAKKQIKINRFPAKKIGGESFMFFNFQKEALDFKPDVIIAHVYRHNHTLQSLKIARKLKKSGKETKVLLVTHAPFGRESSRSKIANLIVFLYDKTIGKLIINRFDKIIRISNWEEPYVKELGVDSKKLIYIPNGISEDFFSLKNKQKSQTKILQELIYTGRISPIKNLETLILSLKYLDKKIKLKILGPAEEVYLESLLKIVKENKLEKQIKIENKTFDRKEQISNLDGSEIFVLPSLTEGHPQSLIEAMARAKIIVASNNQACKDIIVNGKNGFLFETGNPESLAKKIQLILKMKLKDKEKIQKDALETAEKFRWKKLINKLLEAFK